MNKFVRIAVFALAVMTTIEVVDIQSVLATSTSSSSSAASLMDEIPPESEIFQTLEMSKLVEQQNENKLKTLQEQHPLLPCFKCCDGEDIDIMAEKLIEPLDREALEEMIALNKQLSELRDKRKKVQHTYIGLIFSDTKFAISQMRKKYTTHYSTCWDTYDLFTSDDGTIELLFSPSLIAQGNILPAGHRSAICKWSNLPTSYLDNPISLACATSEEAINRLVRVLQTRVPIIHISVPEHLFKHLFVELETKKVIHLTTISKTGGLLTQTELEPYISV